MKRTVFALALALTSGTALAAEPIGEWLVEEGLARIRVENCGDRLVGFVSWEKEPGGIDRYNPDPSKRARPTLGMPVLLNMIPTNGNRWKGEIYNSENGKTYTGSISLSRPDVLRVEGCVLGFLCGGQDWARYKPEPTPTTGRATPQPPQQPRARAGQPPKLDPMVRDACAAMPPPSS